MTKIEDQNEVQFRQIHPSFIDLGEPSSQAFKPTPKDEGKLSLDRSATTTAEDSFNNFKSLGLKSDSVYGLTPAEFSDDPHPVECHKSPLEDNPHHSHADFGGLTNSQQKRKAKELKRKAIKRGKLHP